MFSAEATYHTSTAKVITRLNHGLFRRAVEARFLTTIYGMLSPDGGFLYTNAGHNAPILVSGDSVRRLEVGGMVLGLFEHASFEEETLTLKPGDIIVSFSDGLTEALNVAGDEFGDDHLVERVKVHKEKSPEELLEALVSDVRAFCGEATQSDDMTVVLVRYDGPTTGN
jgi:sigma-B regulation protein RsbU (phosphoserine phosphatase)